MAKVTIKHATFVDTPEMQLERSHLARMVAVKFDHDAGPGWELPVTENQIVYGYGNTDFEAFADAHQKIMHDWMDA